MSHVDSQPIVVDRRKELHQASVRRVGQAFSVDLTMSVNITVASTRSGSGPRRKPVKLLDLVNNGVRIAAPWDVIDAG